MLNAPIRVDEFGAPVSSSDLEVWTGTNTDGTKSGVGDYCVNWTNNDSVKRVQIGNADFTNASWTNDPTEDKRCDEEKRLYCFADATSN
jgi:hypothetical protein